MYRLIRFHFPISYLSLFHYASAAVIYMQDYSRKILRTRLDLWPLGNIYCYAILAECLFNCVLLCEMQFQMSYSEIAFFFQTIKRYTSDICNIYALFKKK